MARVWVQWRLRPAFLRGELVETSCAEAVQPAALVHVQLAGKRQRLRLRHRRRGLLCRERDLGLAPAEVHVGRETRDEHQRAQHDPQEESRDHGKYWRTSARIFDQFGMRLPPGPPPCHNGGSMTIWVIESGLSKLDASGSSVAIRSRPMLGLTSPPSAAARLGTSAGDICFDF